MDNDTYAKLSHQNKWDQTDSVKCAIVSKDSIISPLVKIKALWSL